MNRWLIACWSVLGAPLCVSACAGQGGQELRLAEDLGRARAESAWQAEHAVALEARLKQLEQRIAALPVQRDPADREILTRLDRLIAENASLAAQRSASPAVAGPPAIAEAAPAVSAPLTCVLDAEKAPEDQLRSVVEGLRGRLHRSTGPLTREQNAALRLLLRPQRQLDSENPWPTPWY